jgi:hypothetical protein
VFVGVSPTSFSYLASTKIIRAGFLGLARTSGWNRNGYYTAGIKPSVLMEASVRTVFSPQRFSKRIILHFLCGAVCRTAVGGDSVTQKNILLSLPAAYTYRLHKMCLVFTSNILGYILQTK